MPSKKLTKDQIYEIFKTFHAEAPKPETELKYVNNFTLLVAVVLSAQATDVGVNKATKDLFKIVDTPQKMVDLGLEKLKTYVKTIGLYNTKAQNVIKLSQQLLDLHNGDVPDDREALEDLPGVGRKTANVVLNVAFGHPTIAVDTHIFRVSNRIGLAPGKTPLAVEKGLEKVIPDDFIEHAHHWLILHGRYICKARKPLCSKCPIVDLCQFKDKNFLP